MYAGVAGRFPILQRHMLIHIHSCPIRYIYKGACRRIFIAVNRQRFSVIFRAQIQNSFRAGYCNRCIGAAAKRMTVALDGRRLDGRLLAVGQYIVAFQGDILHQNDLVFCVAGLVVNLLNRILKTNVVPDLIRLRHGARRRQRQHADRYAQRLPNLPVHRFLPFLRFILFVYTAFISCV